MKGFNVSYNGQEHSLLVKEVPVDKDPKNLQYYIFRRKKYEEAPTLLYIIVPEFSADGEPRLTWKYIAYNGEPPADPDFVSAIGEALERQLH